MARPLKNLPPVQMYKQLNRIRGRNAKLTQKLIYMAITTKAGAKIYEEIGKNDLKIYQWNQRISHHFLRSSR